MITRQALKPLTNANIYPTSDSHSIQVDLLSETKKDQPALIKIINQQGKVVYSKITSDLLSIVHLSTLQNGIYDIKIEPIPTGRMMH